MAKRLETLWWTNHALPSWEETFLRNNGRWQIRESKKEPRFHMGVQKHCVLLRKVQTADNTIPKKVSDSQTLSLTGGNVASSLLQSRHTGTGTPFGAGNKGSSFPEGRQGAQERRCRGLTLSFWAIEPHTCRPWSNRENLPESQVDVQRKEPMIYP